MLLRSVNKLYLSYSILITFFTSIMYFVSDGDWWHDTTGSLEEKDAFTNNYSFQIPRLTTPHLHHLHSIRS